MAKRVFRVVSVCAAVLALGGPCGLAGEAGLLGPEKDAPEATEARKEPDLSPERWRALTKRQAEVIGAIRKRQAEALAENPEAREAALAEAAEAEKLLAEARELESRAARLRQKARQLRGKDFRQGVATADPELKKLYEEYAEINRELALHRGLRRQAEKKKGQAEASGGGEGDAPEPEGAGE